MTDKEDILINKLNIMQAMPKPKLPPFLAKDHGNQKLGSNLSLPENQAFDKMLQLPSRSRGVSM